MNVIPLVWTDRKDFEYFPLDEDHPTRVDEPYGLSKVCVPDEHLSQMNPQLTLDFATSLK